MTLAFVEEKTEAGLRDALFTRRTAVYWKDILIGEEKFLKPIFEQSVKILNPSVKIRGRGRAGIHIKNTSQIPFRLVSEDMSIGVVGPKTITLHPDATVIISIRVKSEGFEDARQIRLAYRVENLWIAPEERLHVEFKVSVNESGP